MLIKSMSYICHLYVKIKGISNTKIENSHANTSGKHYSINSEIIIYAAVIIEYSANMFPRATPS